VNSDAELVEMLAQGYHADVRTAIAACGERAFTHGLTSTQARKVSASNLLARLKARLAEDAIPAAAVEVEEPAAPADDAPATRDEMLQQAEILGIKPDKRWSDATLMAKINAAMNPAFILAA
jgi:hypothetical protein